MLGGGRPGRNTGSWLTATMNIVASVFLGLLAVRAGIVVAKTWLT